MAELIGQSIEMLNSLMSHFFEGSIRFEMLQDGEWTMYGGLYPTPKLEELTGALADIIVLLAVSTDHLLQVLI